MIDVDPRDPLSNAKWEKFCRLIFDGATNDDAYVGAGYKANHGNAGRLRITPAIRSRIEYLKKAAAEAACESSAEAIKAAGLTREWVLERLMQNAEEALGRKLTKMRVRLKKDLKNGKPNIVEMEVTSIDRSAGNKALELLGKEMALFEGDGAKESGSEVEAARSAADPRVADQLNGVKLARLHLVAGGGKKTA
jgi:hypothetical protein